MKVSVVKQVVLLRFLVSSANLKFNPQKFFLPVFIGLFLLTVTATAQTTYYVSYNGNDINGTGSQSNPWRTIQNAIDKAVPRDIIKVMDDNDSTTADFTENVIVNKPLTITRFDSVDANPQVKADKCNQHVFMITADNVIIIGLDIYGATEKNLAGIYLDNVSGCKILNNRCGWGNSCLNYIGILNFAGNKNLLLYNSCILNSYCGIKLDSLSTNNIVMGNICQPNRNGGCGICLQYSIKNTISGNHCTNGSSTEGIKLLFSNENVISDNDCSHHIDGTCIELRNSSYNSILKTIVVTQAFVSISTQVTKI